VTVSEIWRYPVKSMGGELLSRISLGPLGIDGDRVVHAEDGRGRVITSRTHPALLGHKATIGTDGSILVDGRPWDSPEVADQIRTIGGAGARLVRYEGAERFDVLPLLVATDGAIAAFGHDRRRLRPNIVIGGVDGLDERAWPGSCLRIANVLVGVQDLRQRCIMTSYHPDTLVQDRAITRDIFTRLGGRLALNCFVVEAGEIAIGDHVRVVRGRACTAADPALD
jgi:uncharacterized protein YcbX